MYVYVCVNIRFYLRVCVISPYALFDRLRHKGHLSAAILDNPTRAHHDHEHFITWYLIKSVCIYCMYVCMYRMCMTLNGCMCSILRNIMQVGKCMDVQFI